MSEALSEQIGLRIAGALLLHYGEISIRDIRALPFFTNPLQVENAVEFIMQNFNVETYVKLITSEPIPQWEKCLKLRYLSSSKY
jgi:hypothetical protein